MTSHHLIPQKAQWASTLYIFHFEILHTPGKLNPADPASRRPDYVVGRHTDDKVVLLCFRSSSTENTDNCALTLSDSVWPAYNHQRSFFYTRIWVYYPFYQGALRIRLLDQLWPKYFLRSKDGLWWWRDSLYVPEYFCIYLIIKYHGDPSSGHWGLFFTLDLISQSISWPNMHTKILSYISSCAQCQQIKVDHRRPSGELMPLSIPDRPWSKIWVDFIVKLPLSHGFDSVMVVVNHFTKATHFIPALESWNASKLARQSLSLVFKLNGLLDQIVSYWGATFVSHFWTSIMPHLPILPAPSMNFHPETDGQVERTNTILEDFLWHFVGSWQDDWSLWLPIAEFSYNNTPSASTSHSLFFACYGFHPCFNALTTASTVPKADDWLTTLHDIKNNLVSSLERAKAPQARFHKRHR